MAKTTILSPLTFSRILLSALAVVALGVVVSAQTVVRTNGGTQTATGTDVSVVQKADNFANGDVISVSGTSETSIAPFTASVRLEGSYTVDTFTVQSGTSEKQYIGGLASNRNYVLKYYKDYDLTFKNVEFQNTGNAQNTFGIFLTMNATAPSGSTTTPTVTLNLDNASFTKFKASGSNNGGVLYSSTANLTINGSNVVSFHNNSASLGSAIICSKAVTIDCHEIIFDSNAANDSGAIRNNGALTITGSKVTFNENTAKGSGGSIYSDNTVNITGNGNSSVLTFTDNTATNEGGVIYSTGGIEIDSNTINISGNTAGNYGGAIRLNSSSAKVFITGETVTIDKNSALSKNGGAIHTNGNVELKGKSDKSVFTLSNNSAPNGNSGVMVVVGTVDISIGTFKFQNNSVKGIGGAIEARAGITFHGDNTSATFTGNIAGTNGDDIYLDNSSVLTFKDSGTYSFDGGIYLVKTGASTVINKAQVTIAGRQYKPVINEGDPTNVEDHTNNYQLQTVKISNGGKLTANLDYIDSLTGKFNLGTADTVGTLELNFNGEEPLLLTMSDTFKITGTSKGEVVKSGDGTLQIYADAANMIDVSKLVVSSGRMDMKEYFTGSLEVGEETSEGVYSTAIFSPGNSVGTLTITGDFVLNPGSTLLIEQDATGIDTLSATSFDIASDSILDLPVDSLQLGASYPIIQSNTAFDDTMASDDFWNGLLTSDSAYYWNLKVVNGNTVMASVDSNAVPEPSTWALLILGAAGLMYWRKRK
ncbi:MAG: PEP-CTERM sorting domain-containing protein [Thermoguttaceae bacterium]|nr:PEP-CTERM sorting domain-containing protein [Thermoguttaceae bacterium]